MVLQPESSRSQPCFRCGDAAQANGAVDFRILGHLEVWRSGRPLEVRRTKPRILLAVLLLHAETVMSTDRIIDFLWGENPPKTARAAVQVYVAGLRKVLEADPSSPEILLTKGSAYRLLVPEESLDASRFAGLVAKGSRELAAGSPSQASTTLGEALGLWRGDPLSDLPGLPFLEDERRCLEALRRSAVEEWVEAQLALGLHAQMADHLWDLVGEEPYRERRWGQLMVALYRCGRQREAIHAYQAAHRQLAEVGIAPGAGLQEIEVRILTNDPALHVVDASMPWRAFAIAR